MAMAMAKEMKIIELRPSVTTNVNTTFIILEKGPPSRLPEGGANVCVALVADATASVHLQLWGPECDAFQPSDIVRLTNGIFTFHKLNVVLRAGKKGALEKTGEFCQVFVESPNMSRVTWVPDPSNPKQYIPQLQMGPGVLQGGHFPHGALLNSPRGHHQY